MSATLFAQTRQRGTGERTIQNHDDMQGHLEVEHPLQKERTMTVPSDTKSCELAAVTVENPKASDAEAGRSASVSIALTRKGYSCHPNETARESTAIINITANSVLTRYLCDHRDRGTKESVEGNRHNDQCVRADSLPTQDYCA